MLAITPNSSNLYTMLNSVLPFVLLRPAQPMALRPWPPCRSATPPPQIDKDNTKGRMMAWRGTRYWEGWDPCASAMGTFIVHLLNCDGNRRRDMTSRGHRRGRQNKTVAGRGGVR